LEYFTESELITQTGYERDLWCPGVIAKELIDNGLDESEKNDRAPRIHVAFNGADLMIEDNGAGFPAEVVKSILDFSTRTSSKSAYVSPTRGAQGNALKTVLAIPYVMNPESPATIEIEACGLRHVITVSTDHIKRKARIEYRQEQIVRNEGTAIRLRLDSARSKAADGDPGFLQKLVFDYSLFNPHATFSLCQQNGEQEEFPATNTDWRKWKASDPTPPHWYNLERAEELIACKLASERADGRKPRTLREFVADFRGLSSTVKQKRVVSSAGMERAYLHDLVGTQDRLDRDRIKRVLDAMLQASAPVKPELLGVLGEHHFRSKLRRWEGDSSFRYKCVKGIDSAGLPYIVECAFAMTEEGSLLQGTHIGLNWAVPLNDPIQGANRFELSDGSAVHGLEALLAERWIDPELDDVCIALHIVSPRFNFQDRGKGSVSLPFAAEVGKAVIDTTKEWAAIKKSEERDWRQAERRREELSCGRTRRITVKEAAEIAIPKGYAKARGSFPSARARQVMYACRPEIEEMTGKPLNDVYFTQTLLPDYLKAHPEETADWDIVYDARGHLLEPHTEYEFGIGTLGVREYMASLNDRPADQRLEAPELSRSFPTMGPSARFGAILYIEKEGFLELLRQARFGERYDMAICSSKGMGSTSLRTLLENLSQKVMVGCLHDFDKSGFSIVGTLTQDTRRYTYTTVPQIIDLGLRLTDVQRYKLQSESVEHKSDPTENLRRNGAMQEEIEFLRGEHLGGGKYKGKRVELNAFTNDQFVEWLNEKLIDHNVQKVIPNDATLKQAFRRAIARDQYETVVSEALGDVEAYAEEFEIPTDLKERVAAKLKRDPATPWDDAIDAIVRAEMFKKSQNGT
jgi:DNA topoisomerase VI subunit B